jgi:hypothetical protein
MMMVSANDNVRWPPDPLLFQNLFQGQVFYRAQVAHCEIGIVAGIVGERFISSV